eukprot:jgi/Ulvmu1/1166/UM107_0040.1
MWRACRRFEWQLAGLWRSQGSHIRQGGEHSGKVVDAHRCPHTVREALLKHKYRQFCTGPAPAESSTSKARLSWMMVTATLGAATAGYVYIQYNLQKTKAEQLKAYETSVGQAMVGGPFTLEDCDGKPFPSSKLHGEFSVLYFGFTHCPDICPDELEKLAEALNTVEKRSKHKVQPVFISIDPERDHGKLVKEYVREFHPRMIGLRGSLEEVKKVAKLFRVYFMKTNDSPTDYLVDHSIIMYLLDPEGKFVTFYGKSFTAEQIAESLCKYIGEWHEWHA